MPHHPATQRQSGSSHAHAGFIPGSVLMCLSALAFSTAGIFTKSVDASAWEVIFWRGVGAIVCTLAVLHLRRGIRDELRRFGAPALLATLLMASGTAAFIPAFKLTTVANVALIWATAPFVSALLAWAFIKEVPSKRILGGSILALMGVLITAHGSLGAGNILGDMLALWMTVMMAATMVVYRARPDTPTRLPAALSALILLPIAAVLSDPTHVAGPEISILIMFGLVFATASVLLAEGARRVPSAQAALISALETPLAPIWAVLILAEWPSMATAVGGAIVMVAVVMVQAPRRRLGQSDTRAIARLNRHLRRDIGMEGVVPEVQPSWRDPLAREMRRIQ